VVVFNESKIEGKHFSLLILKVGGYGIQKRRMNSSRSKKDDWPASYLIIALRKDDWSASYPIIALKER
jgi:hypothetical protein